MTSGQGNECVEEKDRWGWHAGDHSVEREDTEKERCLEAEVGNEDPTPGLWDLSTG